MARTKHRKLRKPAVQLLTGEYALTAFVRDYSWFWSVITPTTRKLMKPLNRELRSCSMVVPLHHDNLRMFGPLRAAGVGDAVGGRSARGSSPVEAIESSPARQCWEKRVPESLLKSRRDD